MGRAYFLAQVSYTTGFDESTESVIERAFVLVGKKMVGVARLVRKRSLPSKNRVSPQNAECATKCGKYLKIVRPKQQRITLRLTERTDFSRQIENGAILGAEWRPDRARREI